MTIHLRAANLEQIKDKASVPGYRRDQLSAGIFHIGCGNFHRSHQAVYLHELFNTGEGHDWALVGGGVREADEHMRQALMAQDLFTTVVEQEAGKSAAHVTGAMIEFVKAGDAAAMVKRMAQPDVRIVSLTITEGGYYINAATGKFDPEHPDMAHDAKHPDQPKTVFGIILKALKVRRQNGLVPFTVMSCDNIPHNGVVTKNAVAGLADAGDKAFGDWVRDNVAFPNGMVDRITPATGDRERALLKDQFGIEDNWPVFCEDFKQWVLEDKFTAGRPALEKVGVQFVEDVSPFELMKIRILNGGHAVIAYPAGLLDVHFVHEGMEHPLVKAFLDKIETEEIIPCVPPVPNTNIADYYKLIVRRFSNPKIGDTITRLCLDGSNRQPKFIVPSIRDRLVAGKSVTGLALESALWCRYCYGVSDSGKVIPPNDPNWDHLQTVAKAAKDNPDAWLAMDEIYGDVAKSAVFREAFAKALNALWKNGTKATLEAYLADKL
jgi:mannitol 2-dehydrogenase